MVVPLPTLRPNPTAVPFHHFLGEGEANSTAWHLRCCARRAAIEGLKDVRK